jgi:hypothetical protein
VRQEAKSGGYDVRLGHMRNLCGKQSDFEASYRKCQGRVVFLGSAVVDQFHDEANFRVMGSSPATLEVCESG